ncbi:unnamed protein product, partial [Vitrella brassicaformis CCMP3155]
ELKMIDEARPAQMGAMRQRITSLHKELKKSEEDVLRLQALTSQQQSLLAKSEEQLSDLRRLVQAETQARELAEAALSSKTRLSEALRLQISLPEKRRTDRRTLANGACVDKGVQTAKGDGNIWLTKTPHHSHIAPAYVAHLPGAGGQRKRVRSRGRAAQLEGSNHWTFESVQGPRLFSGLLPQPSGTPPPSPPKFDEPFPVRIPSPPGTPIRRRPSSAKAADATAVCRRAKDARNVIRRQAGRRTLADVAKETRRAASVDDVLLSCGDGTSFGGFVEIPGAGGAPPGGRRVSEGAVEPRRRLCAENEMLMVESELQAGQEEEIGQYEETIEWPVATWEGGHEWDLEDLQRLREPALRVREKAETPSMEEQAKHPTMQEQPAARTNGQGQQGRPDVTISAWPANNETQDTPQTVYPTQFGMDASAGQGMAIGALLDRRMVDGGASFAQRSQVRSPNGVMSVPDQLSEPMKAVDRSYFATKAPGKVEMTREARAREIRREIDRKFSSNSASAAGGLAAKSTTAASAPLSADSGSGTSEDKQDEHEINYRPQHEIDRNAGQSGRTNSENPQRQHVSPSRGSGGGGNGNRIFAVTPGVGSRGGAMGRSADGVMSVPAALGTNIALLEGNTVAMGRQGGQTADTDRPNDQLARARRSWQENEYTHDSLRARLEELELSEQMMARERAMMERKGFALVLDIERHTHEPKPPTRRLSNLAGKNTTTAQETSTVPQNELLAVLHNIESPPMIGLPFGHHDSHGARRTLRQHHYQQQYSQTPKRVPDMHRIAQLARPKKQAIILQRDPVVATRGIVRPDDLMRRLAVHEKAVSIPYGKIRPCPRAPVPSPERQRVPTTPTKTNGRRVTYM